MSGRMKQRSSGKQERWAAGAKARGELHLTLSDASFPDFERAFLAHQRERLRAAASPLERLEVRRRTAEDILTGAFSRACTWSDFKRALQRVERLGYTDISRRVHVASLFAQCTGDFPQGVEWARRLLDDAERRLRSVRRNHPLRQEGLAELARVRRMTGWEPTTSSAASGTPRMRPRR
jgi:hypothetical protein